MEVKIGQIWELNKKTDIDKMDHGSYMIILSRDIGRDDDDGVEFNNVALFNWWTEDFGWCGAGVHRFTDEEITRNAVEIMRLSDVVSPKIAEDTARSFER